MTDRIIELPPLPDHWEPSLTAFVLNWGKAAIEADRQRRGKESQWPKVNGVGRDADNDRCLVIYFDKVPTDNHLRAVYDAIAKTSSQSSELSEDRHIDV